MSRLLVVQCFICIMLFSCNNSGGVESGPIVPVKRQASGRPGDGDGEQVYYRFKAGDDKGGLGGVIDSPL